MWLVLTLARRLNIQQTFLGMVCWFMGKTFVSLDSIFLCFFFCKCLKNQTTVDTNLDAIQKPSHSATWWLWPTIKLDSTRTQIPNFTQPNLIDLSPNHPSLSKASRIFYWNLTQKIPPTHILSQLVDTLWLCLQQTTNFLGSWPWDWDKKIKDPIGQKIFPFFFGICPMGPGLQAKKNILNFYFWLLCNLKKVRKDWLIV